MAGSLHLAAESGTGARFPKGSTTNGSHKIESQNAGLGPLFIKRPMVVVNLAKELSWPLSPRLSATIEKKDNFMKDNKCVVIHYLFPALILFGSLVVPRADAMAQDQTSNQDAQNPCRCWIDVKTGKRVRSVPFAGVNTGLAATLDAGVAEVSSDGKTAFNTRTKQNYALEDWELEQGYVLACQSRVKTPVLELDYDEK